jgi:phosphohistidine phosphatase
VLELLLLRHGKSDWEAGAGSDHDRPLAKRGRGAARRMGRLLARVGLVPARAITSSALRARATAELAAAEGGFGDRLEVTSDLYEATPEGVLTLLRSQPGAASPLLLVGHEPTFSAATSLLIGGGRIHLPTAALAALRFDAGAWSEVEAGSGELASLLLPRLLDRLGL